MSINFKTVGIVSRYKTDITGTLNALVTFLKRRKIEIFVIQEIAKILPDQPLNVVNNLELVQQSDVIITVGGDGNLLNASHLAAPHDKPILGINRGKFGFLTDIRPNQIEQIIGEVLDGKFTEEQRFMLQTKISGHTVPGLALNDVVLTPNTNHMLEFTISVNDCFMCNQQSDGLIIATPTGSTAYALSGGGPILHPQLNAIVMVPMFPHTLSHRPIVLDGNSDITITIPKTAKYLPKVSCDGKDYIHINTDSIIKVTKADKALRLIHPLSYDYFASLRGKLYWEQRSNNYD